MAKYEARVRKRQGLESKHGPEDSMVEGGISAWTEG